MQTLHDGELVDVRLDGDVIWVVRKEGPVAAIDVALSNFAILDVKVLGLSRRPRSVVFDQRAIRGRNDPEFEARVVPVVRRFAERFERCAILVGTPAGRLQVQRLARELGWKADVFDDEAKVAGWVRADA